MVFVFAIELQDQVEKYGVYVGLAAFFGLAVLTILYFAQARELKRLREWAGRAPERALELEQRLAAQTAATQPPRPVRAQPIPPPVATPAVAAVARQGTTVHPAAAAIPAAATAAAAKAASPPVPAVAATGDGAGPPAAVEQPTVAVPAVATAGAATATAPVAAGTQTAMPPSPATGDEGPPPPSNGVPAADPPVADRPAPSPPPAPPVKPPVLPRPATAAAAPLRATPPPARRATGAYGAPTSARRTGGEAGSGRSRAGAALIIGLTLASLAAVVLLLTQVLGGDEKPAGTGNQVAEGPAASPTPEDSGGSTKPRQSVASTRKVTTVAVFNGTTTPGLAANLLERLSASGYAEGGKTGNAPEQTVATTTIYYASGQKRQAADAAKIIGGADLKAMDADTQSLAGPNAKLLVIAGSDKAP